MFSQEDTEGTDGAVAIFDGRCGMCDDPIHRDEDLIVRYDGEWVHHACAEDVGRVYA